MTTTYKAIAERSGKWWAVELPDVPGGFTQGRNLKEAAEMAREAVALLLDLPEEEIEIDLQPKLPKDTTTALADFQTRRLQREEAEEAERTAQAAAARALTGAGLSVRDAGVVLGISHQRVAQLAPSSEARTATAKSRSGSRAAGALAGATKVKKVSRTSKEKKAYGAKTDKGRIRQDA
jgi:predicted RNase H-like HicB family nuclease